MARKDIDLSDKIIKILQRLADKDHRKLKAYMEKVLEDHATPKEYKILDCNGAEMPGLYGGSKHRTYDQAKILAEALNKNGEFKPYKIIPIE